MTNTNSHIIDLIEQLRQLRLQELRVLNTLEASLQQQAAYQATSLTADSTTTSTSTHTPTNRSAGDRAVVTTTNTSTPTNRNIIDRSVTPFVPGDHIVVTNRVRVLGRATNKGDKTGVVQRIENRRVYIHTTNGTDTWRAPHSLRIRNEDE
jgi:hypothetical protein